jgi:transcriptional regulator with PAS, ATPase and Fis domain
MGFEGPTIVFTGGDPDTDAGYLNSLSGVECITRPSSSDALDELLQRRVTERLSILRRSDSGPALGPRFFHSMVAKSKAMLEIFARIEKVASGNANICIVGESGTGKELIARAIHNCSDRRDGPLITLDCTAIPEGLMESQLFGHVRGAFTGAFDHREGVFALADTGTLFIDELCELAPPLQAKLLRVIQAREFVKVGGTKAIHTNIRLVTATNRDPKREVEDRNFREDLYYRVAVVMIKVPALRERREDIPFLVEHFLSKFASVYRKPACTVSDGVMERLMGLPWPGNIRQLENVLEQAVVLSEGGPLRVADLPVDDDEYGGGELRTVLQLEAGLPLREVERRHILRTLQKARGNRTQAARLLGISTRCLQYKLKSYFQSPMEPPMRRIVRGPITAQGF